VTSSDGAGAAAEPAIENAVPPGNGAGAGTEPVEAEPAAEAGVETETGPLGFTPPPPMCQLLFVDVSLVLPSTHPVVVLQEAEWPYRELRIPVGGAEGVAIGYAARRVPTPRPLTHQMVSDLLDTFELTLDQVRITAVHGSNFVAELVVSGRLGVRTIDCRPSDAIALALRRPIPVPIMASPEVLDLAGAAAAGAN
jgi:bifunctional DNase/RNase